MPHPTDEEAWTEYHVTPRYLAGSSWTGDPGLAPVNHWPHHQLDDGPCQLLVTSPDARIKIGWFGDDYDLWKISAAEDAVTDARWTATFNHTTPPEIVAGLTTALEQDWADGNDRFLRSPLPYWANGITPLTDAGWKREASEPDTVKIVAPDGQAGLRVDQRIYDPTDEIYTFWSGPPGWSTRTEATFTAWADPAPVIRERHMVNARVQHLVQLTPVQARPTAVSTVPTPLDVRQTAVNAALHRAARRPDTAARVAAAQVAAARTKTTTPLPHQPSTAATPPATSPSYAAGRSSTGRRR